MAETGLNNPATILETLDSFLEKETRIVLFGRAALALGFGKGGEQFGKTQDVDAILPLTEMSKIEADIQFWKAIELTNKALERNGLYISHLFTDEQVTLTSGWLERIVKIDSSQYKHLQLSRPHAVDLILTKMMRNDREDIEDIKFLFTQGKITPPQLEAAFSNVRFPPMPELRDIFAQMQPTVRSIAATLASEHSKDLGKDKSNILDEIIEKAPYTPGTAKGQELER